MADFINIPVTNEKGDELETLRVNTEYITDYRRWLNTDNKEQTVFFFDSKIRKKKLVADITVMEVDKQISKTKK
jgi:hypothetical protein